MTCFFREQKLLIALVMMSVTIILAGLFMIRNSNKNAAEIDVTARDAEQLQATINTMTVIAENAERKLQESGSTAKPVDPVGDIKPQESLDKVAALNGLAPEVGSEDWCEVMMVKDADAWTKEEQEIFAQRCL